jgi:putative tryptophan/tyrosine transport system substrate-binding protein
MQFDRLKRRELISLIGAAAVWPLAARAQQPERMRRIGVLMMYAESDAQAQALVAVFRAGLRDLGWTEDHKIRLDYHWATSDSESIQRSAKELVALEPDLILSSSTPTTALLLQQTRTIPIIFANIVDPVGSGKAKANVYAPGTFASEPEAKANKRCRCGTGAVQVIFAPI